MLCSGCDRQICAFSFFLTLTVLYVCSFVYGKVACQIRKWQVKSAERKRKVNEQYTVCETILRQKGSEYIVRSLLECKNTEVRADYAMLNGAIFHYATLSPDNDFIRLDGEYPVSDSLFELRRESEYVGNFCGSICFYIKFTDFGYKLFKKYIRKRS